MRPPTEWGSVPWRPRSTRGHEVLVASRGGGATWVSIASDLPSLDTHGFAGNPTDPARMWAHLATGGLWTSSDYGARGHESAMTTSCVRSRSAVPRDKVVGRRRDRPRSERRRRRNLDPIDESGGLTVDGPCCHVRQADHLRRFARRLVPERGRWQVVVEHGLSRLRACR